MPPRGKKNKVLYITYLGLLEPLPKSQVLPYLFGLCEEAEIHLISFEKKEITRRYPEELRRLEDKLRGKGIIWHRLSYHKYPLLVSSFFDILAGITVSFSVVSRYGIKIIHARSNVPIAIGYVLRLCMPVKLLYDRRGIMGTDHTEHSGWKQGGYLHRLAVWFELKAIKRSDAIVVLTDKVREKLTEVACPRGRAGGDNDMTVVTIPCCVDLELFNIRRADEEFLPTADPPPAEKTRLGLSGRFVFVYSGSVGTYNLLNEMFDFFNEAVKLIPTACFLVLTQNEKRIEEFLKERPDIAKDRIIVSYAPQDRLPDFLSIADAGFVFRRTSPTAIAASPTKFGEYLACGLPVISTPHIGDLDDIINSNEIGIVLNGYEKSDYIQAVTKLLVLLKEKAALKKRCRKTAEAIYSLDRGVGIYKDIYERLAAKT